MYVDPANIQESYEKAESCSRYAQHLVTQLYEKLPSDRREIRSILGEATEYARRSNFDEPLAAVGKAWLDFLDDRNSAIKAVVHSSEQDDFPDFTWVQNCRRLHAVFGEERLDFIKRRLPEFEKQFPVYLLDWAHEWGLLGPEYRKDMLRCIQKAERRSRNPGLDQCRRFAKAWSEVPPPKFDETVEAYLESAEESAYNDEPLNRTYNLVACAWEWREIYGEERRERYDRLFGDAEAAACTVCGYLRLADYLTYEGKDTVTERRRVKVYAAKAKKLVHTREDRLGYSRLRWLAVED